MIKGMTPGAKSAAPGLAIDPSSMAWICVMMIPMAVFISALMVAAGLFARSSKEANTYLQPMLFLAILPAAAGGLPGVEMNYRLAMIPVFNVSFMAKEILSGVFHWNYIGFVFAMMTVCDKGDSWRQGCTFKKRVVLFRT